jgi:hypothetical protein
MSGGGHAALDRSTQLAEQRTQLAVESAVSWRLNAL